MQSELPDRTNEELREGALLDAHIAERLSSQSRHAAIWTALGVGAVLISLAWSYESIRSATQQLNEISGEVKGLKAKKAELQSDIDNLTRQRNALFDLSNGLLKGTESPGVPGGGGKDAAQQLKAVVEANPSIAQVIPRVYLQIGRQDQRAFAGRIAESLRVSGFTVPGTEFVGAAKAPPVTQVRYFHPLQECVQDVDKLAASLKAAGVNAKPQYIKMPDGTKTPSARQYEVWFSLSQFDSTAAPTAR